MRSTHSTAPDTAIAVPAELGWSARMSLRQRILAVNILAILLLAGSFFYLDSYRMRLIDERVRGLQTLTAVTADALVRLPPAWRNAYLGVVGRDTGARLRLADTNGDLLADSWRATGPTIQIRDPADEPWQRDVARWLDDGIEAVVDAGDPVPFTGFAPPSAWPRNAAGWKLARDRTHLLWASRAIEGPQPLLLMTEANPRDIRRLVRAERTRAAWVIALIAGISVLLSIFLARTIEQPLRALADAAMRVRHGRAREVDVPRLPSRRDEIGLLARSLSDMTHTLRQRIDAIEAFAADVAHELKNPLASLSSAAQSLATVEKPELRAQLIAIVAEDVVRLDRLITDISTLSRLDAQLARSRFERVDMGALIAGLLAGRAARGQDGDVQIAFARPAEGVTAVQGDRSQLERLIQNLLANAISFSPPGGVVRIAATRDGDEVAVLVDDEGPGIPESARAAVFERFHTDRPSDEAFGRHSGLGLSIARTVVEGHDGSIAALSREDGHGGARLSVRLPAAGE